MLYQILGGFFLVAAVGFFLGVFGVFQFSGEFMIVPFAMGLAALFAAWLAFHNKPDWRPSKPRSDER